MASAAAEAEKGSPVVVGLLVVGNIIILVRPPPVLGAQWAGREEGIPGGGGSGPRTPGLVMAAGCQARAAWIPIPALRLPSFANSSKPLSFFVLLPHR